MILDNPNKKLEIILGSAKTTTDMPVCCSYEEKPITGITGSVDTQTNGVTAVPILTGGQMNTTRWVKDISVLNVDTVAKVVTVRLNNNGVLRPIYTCTLQVGDMLGYADYRGWYVKDANGNEKTIASVGGAVSIAQDFRLTLTSGLPVTTADVTAAATVYCTPYRGNEIGLWNGTAFQNYASAEMSIPLGTLVAGKAYDIFCYQNAGVPTLELGAAWTNDTTRAVALAYQNGVLVKSGDPTRRYLGSFYTISTTQTCDMELHAGATTGRYLYNYYNRIARSMKRYDSTPNWVYTTAVIRQANANAANQLNFILGVAEDAISAQVSIIINNTNATGGGTVGIGLDSTIAFHADALVDNGFVSIANGVANPKSSLTVIPSAGRHFLSWLEYAPAFGTTTWYGNGGGANARTGMTGSLMA